MKTAAPKALFNYNVNNIVRISTNVASLESAESTIFDDARIIEIRM